MLKNLFFKKLKISSSPQDNFVRKKTVCYVFSKNFKKEEMITKYVNNKVMITKCERMQNNAFISFTRRSRDIKEVLPVSHPIENI
jgi:hypothetical protein